jgi:hypothetical protein
VDQFEICPTDSLIDAGFTPGEAPVATEECEMAYNSGVRPNSDSLRGDFRVEFRLPPMSISVSLPFEPLLALGRTGGGDWRGPN